MPYMTFLKALLNYQLVEMDAMHACYTALLETYFSFLSETFNNYLLKSGYAHANARSILNINRNINII